MPNSTVANDCNFNAIEAAVRETTRGRAFLADYATKVRQSDTLTMLALIRRLERWSEDQDTRLAQFEGRDPAFANPRPEVHVCPAVGFRGVSTEEMTGCEEVSPRSDGSEVLPVTVCDQNSASVGQTADDTGTERLDLPQTGGAIDRIENLANALRDLDRRLVDLTDRRSAIGRFANKNQSAPIVSVDDGVGSAISHSVESNTMNGSPHTAEKTRPPDDDILDDIAKALETVE
jgi:hypothetical protein